MRKIFMKLIKLNSKNENYLVINDLTNNVIEPLK